MASFGRLAGCPCTSVQRVACSKHLVNRGSKRANRNRNRPVTNCVEVVSPAFTSWRRFLGSARMCEPLASAKPVAFALDH